MTFKHLQEATQKYTRAERELRELLHLYLENQHDQIAQDGFIVNKFEELQAAAARVKYKMENLK